MSEGWVSGGDERGMGERRRLKCRFPLLTVVMYSYLVRAAIGRTAAGGSHFESYFDCWRSYPAMVRGYRSEVAVHAT
jgi:hypothetical protein